MISKYSVSTSAVVMLMNLSINNVQSITMDNTIVYDKDLSCSDCIRSGNIWAYEDNTFTASNNRAMNDRCFSSDSDTPDQPGFTEYELSSEDFTDLDYALLACPQTTDGCGSKFVDLSYKDPTTYMDMADVVTRDQMYDDEGVFSCGYIVRADCGVPYVSITDAGGITADTLEVSVFEFAMDSMYLMDLAERDYNDGDEEALFNFPSGYKDELVFVDSSLFDDIYEIADLDAYVGTDEEYMGMFRMTTLDEDYDTQIMIIDDYQEAIETYYDDLDAYQEGLLAYQKDYIEILVELWDDFIGVPRMEGQEMAKSTLTAKLPTAPVHPMIDEDYSMPMPADFECLGNACKSHLTFEEDNAKAFGIISSTGTQGYDFNYESAEFYMMNYEDPDISIYRFAPYNFENGLLYSEAICRPKVMYVTISVKDKDYVPEADDMSELTFGIMEPNEDIRNSIGAITEGGFYESDYMADMAPLPGASDISSFATTYEADGATALYGSVAVSAALAAMTLY